MTFEEQAAELHQIEDAAKRLGILNAHFERIALAVTTHGGKCGWTPEQQLVEIRARALGRGQGTNEKNAPQPEPRGRVRR